MTDADTVTDADIVTDGDMVTVGDTVTVADMLAETGVAGTGLLRLLIEPQDESADGAVGLAAAAAGAVALAAAGADAALDWHLLAVGTRAPVVAAAVTLGVG